MLLERQAELGTVGDELPIHVARRFRYGRWLGVVVAIVLVAMLANTLLTNPRFEWSVVWEYLFDPVILAGIQTTLALAAVGMVLGVILGVGLALARLSPNRILSGAAGVYSWFFRATPLLVQLIIWFNLAALFPQLSLGIPFGPQFVTFDANTLITPVVAAVVAFSLNEAAYMAEIIRGGLLSVDPGQALACESLGLSRFAALRRVIMPQAMRAIIPATGNEMLYMLKNTALVSVIALADLLYSAQLIISRTYQTIPLLIVACIWYLAMTSVVMYLQKLVERRYSRGFDVRPPTSGWLKFLRIGGGR